MARYASSVIRIAEAEVGYLEKNNLTNLTSKTANAGTNNYTKYWADLAPSYQGQPWCNCFVNWCFVQAYGVAAAKELLCTSGGWSYYTPTSAQYFKNNNQWSKTPSVGAIIYFKNSTRIHHVGLVYKVDSTYVYTIEGNTSSQTAVVANGGGVFKKKYYRSNTAIAGYGIPKYDAEQEPTSTQTQQNTSYSKVQFIKDVQAAIGATVDGVAGPITLSKTVTVSSKVNRTHKVVLPLQKYLNALGYNCGTQDGIAGAKFTAAVIQYQKAKGCEADGEITKQGKTWKKLLGLA